MPDERWRRVAERIWFGRDPGARAARLLLLPLSVLFRGVVAARNFAYDLGLAPSHIPVIPTLSVGNLTVGGTGKTPLAAWLASELQGRGARPAIVMRGVGNDETKVHQLLNPDLPVITSPDRVAGAATAAATGANVVVLDDAFQHRRVKRLYDIVLLSADTWRRPRHVLPAGAWREPLSALQRATIVVVTRKAATANEADAVRAAIAKAAPDVAVAVVRLEPGELRRLDAAGERQPMSALLRRRVLAICAIGDPTAFVKQIADAGTDSIDAAIFPDHHPYDDADVRDLRARAASADVVVCTLKDAVKLAPAWTRAGAPLWYVSQRVVVESGKERLDALLVELSARPASRALGAAPGAVSQPS
ncbi:MAG TPA: tetraacyldisaccharide 4'-kinase [Gemmatimonadaceae bacterium]|nr:tetraacyldisaccharide 4'-kinase [Gemmatimonadaceae bacterium]